MNDDPTRMNDPIYQKLRETSWQRKLTPAEQAELRAWLAAHPEAQVEWEAERGLNQLLRGLTDVPVASNFTARVLQASELERAAAMRQPAGWSWLWRPEFFRRGAVPRAAVVVAVLCAGFGLFSYHQSVVGKQVRLAQKARSVATISEVSSLPDPEVLCNFEAIRQLPSKPAVSAVDKNLFAVLSYLQ